MGGSTTANHWIEYFIDCMKTGHIQISIAHYIHREIKSLPAEA